MNIKLVILIAIVIISCKTTSTITKTNAVSLFNGKDLSGWAIFGTEKWYVKNGLLFCENGKDEEFGYLATVKKYKNFELNLDFKQGVKSNGGVFIHALVKDTKIEGWQVEIGPPGHNTGGIHTYDRGWLIKPDLIKDKILKMGTWNHLKIRLKDDKIVVWLNDIEMVSFIDQKLKNTNGAIALQINKGKATQLQWRNITIVEL